MALADLTYLVVEDNDFQRRWLTAMLDNLGATKILEASNGVEALRLLQDRGQGIDICFIDLKLPEMDGLELIRHMARSENPVSIVLASALDPALVFSVETMSHAYGVNLLGTVIKPATPEGLLALIAKHVPPQLRPAKAAGPQLALDDILLGLEQDQILPYFQPKVEIATGWVKSVEAFARWQHPQLGLLSAAAFVPMLEENGLADKLAWIIIEKSLAACRWLAEQNHATSVSINLSSVPLAEVEFAERFVERAASYGVAPKSVIAEITESASKSDTPAFLENLARLRMKGFMLAVDDYGTGDASMQHHLRVPFSELKIDRSFVAGASQNQALQMALSSSLELAQKLNRESTGVGVETRQDWDLLQKLGCTNAQGYFIAKPMELKALPAWMDEWAQFF
jgi:EAL domain-containing protein (putative c-di-GMP-specific phosphodiesterase class I)